MRAQTKCSYEADGNLSSPAHLCQQAMYLAGMRVRNRNTDPSGDARVGAKSCSWRSWSPGREGRGARVGFLTSLAARC